MKRPLPSESEARDILVRRKTRPAPRPAPPAGRSLAKFVRDLDQKYGRGASALEPRWREIVGDRLARVTRPHKLVKARGDQGGILELRVAGPAALLVQHQSQEILERVNLFLGDGTVSALRISQGPVKPIATPAVSTKGARRRLAPLDASVEAELDASLGEASPGLRDALKGLGRAVLSETRPGSRR